MTACTTGTGGTGGTGGMGGMGGDGHDGDHDGAAQQVECTDLGTTPTKASEWVDFVNWDEATRVEMATHEVSDEGYHFMPENLEFVEGCFPQFVETSIVQYTELAYMLQGMKTPEQAMKDVVKQTNDITGYTKLMKAAGKE